MSNILIIGGGFAGLWTAAGIVKLARESGAADTMHVTLVDAADDLVIRPRLYELDPQQMRVSLDRVLGPIGVDRVAATVTRIDTDARTVAAVGRDGTLLQLTYDRLVLAAGSRLRPPTVPGAEHLFDIDQMSGAAALHSHLHRLPARAAADGRFTAVVVGAGFTGIEIATELPARLRAVATAAGVTDPVRVVLIDREPVVGPELGEGPRPLILDALAELGVELHLGTSLDSVGPDSVTLTDGTTIPAATVLWTAGMAASLLTAQIPAERDAIGRLAVDKHLRVVGVPDVYAVGDTAAAIAEDGHVVMQSCQHAVPQGKFAGHNVAADLLGLPPVAFSPDPYSTCLDLGPAGAVATTGWDRAVALTGEQAKALKASINGTWIYPPVDDAEAILGQAGWRTIWPIDKDAAYAS